MWRMVKILTLAALFTAADTGALRAQLTRRDFFTPIIADDALPANQLDLTPWDVEKQHGSTFAMNFELDKKLSANSDIELSSPLNAFSPTRRKQVTGFQDIEAIMKYAFYESDEHESACALGLDTIFPTGNRRSGSVRNFRTGPLFLWDQGMGDLDNAGFLRYLRPFALQGDVGILPVAGNPASAAILFDNALSYSLDYLVRSSRAPRLPAALAALIPFTEFNYVQVPLGAPRLRSGPDLRLTPGVAYLNGPYQLTVGTQAPLNDTARRDGFALVVVMLAVTLDEIFPPAGFTLF
jgi:hypothetical protein